MNTRTMAFQVDEALFRRIKAHLTRTGLTQRAFVISVIEDALTAAETAAEVPTLADAESDTDTPNDETVADAESDDTPNGEPLADAEPDADEPPPDDAAHDEEE